MSEPINVTRLYELLDELSPEEIRSAYGERLDEESRQVFAAFQQMNTNLLSLPADLSRLAPPVPYVEEPQAQVVSFWQRRMIPTWAMPLAAAAIFFMGMVIPQQTAAVTPDTQLAQATDTMRGPVIVPEPTKVKYDANIADALSERGASFMDDENYASALRDFKAAYELNPEDTGLLDYLIVVTSAMGMADEQQHYQNLKDQAGN